MFEPGDGRRSEGFPFLFDDGGDMRRVFNALATVVTATMASDFQEAVQDANGGLRSDQSQWPADTGVRNRVIIEIICGQLGYVA